MAPLHTNAVCLSMVLVPDPCCMQILPHDGETYTVAMYGIVMVMCGLLKSWAAPAFNNW